MNSPKESTIFAIDDIKLSGSPTTPFHSDQEDYVLTWDNVSYSVPIKNKEKKQILQDMTGFIKSGEVVAIMGGSGAGKSTLLNCLAGRIGPGELTGEIRVNGQQRDEATWKRLCAYVEQEDIMYSNLTVEETLMYSATLRLPSTLSVKQKKARVEELIMDLGLSGCRNTRIGNALSRGVSGGERKRVSIGIELVTQPKILFLDEPTSGLDSFNAFNVIDNIKKLALAQKKIVLMTIHQPRTDILELFDKIILLSAGKAVWYGTTSDALDHFSFMGFSLPPKTNPSDFFLDIITLDQRTIDLRESSMRRIEKFAEEWKVKSNHLATQHRGKRLENQSPESLEAPWPNNWFAEFYILLSRNMKDVSRDKATIGATLGQGFIVMILFGFIFFQVGNDAAGVQNRIGLFFMLVTNATFGVVMPTLNVFPLERVIIKRERAAGTYRSSSSFLAKVLSTLPLLIVGNLILAVPIYWMVGLQPIISKYLIFVLVILVHVFTANALGLMIGSIVTSVKTGQIFGPLIIVVFLLFGGQVLNLDQVPDVFKWIQWISIISYSNKALSQNEFVGLEFDCPNLDSICYKSGEQVLDIFKLNNPDLWYCVIINIALSVGFLILGLFAFNRTSAPQIRLK